MTTACLVEPISLTRNLKPQSLKWNPSVQIRFSSTKNHCTFITKSSRSQTNCSSEKNLSLMEEISDSTTKAVKALQKPAIVAAMIGLLLYCDPDSALAASGGRMGGKSFSKQSSPRNSYSTRTKTELPRSSFSYSVPFYAPSPFSFGPGNFGFGGFGVFFNPFAAAERAFSGLVTTFIFVSVVIYAVSKMKK